MEKINYRFLNYKRYSKFLEDLNNNKVREDAIVFIQDNLRIWARGKEYVCDGPSNTKVAGDTLTFTNGLDNTVMSIHSANGTITFTDSSGRTLQTTFALNDNFREEIDRLGRLIQANWDNLATVAKTGLYSDLINKPDPLTVDSTLSSSSTNPVQNKAIYDALSSKVDSTTLDLYVQKTLYDQGMGSKQNKLTAGYGIDITNDKISSTIDTNLYVIVTELPSVEDANPDKIYLVEIPNGDSTYRYEQYRLRNGQWVLIGNASTNVDLSKYLKSADAENLYQPKRNDYALTGDLLLYTPLAAFQDLQQSLSNYVQYAYLVENYQPKGEYALESWVTQNFVKKIDVYTPVDYDGSNETPGTGGGSSTIDVPSSANNITVDTELSSTSANPVENRVITNALNTKADKSELRSYATKEELNSKVDNIDLTAYVTTETYEAGLDTKQDTLTPGRGISIVNNTISSTLDTDVFVIVNSLPSQGNPNKIYLVETVENDEVTYVEWRWRYDEPTDTWDWVEIGQKDPGIDLTDYLTKTEAASTYITEATADGKYQLKGDYMTRSEAQTQHNTLSNLIEALRDELEDDYVTDDQLDALQLYIRQTFQRKGNYVLAEDVSTALNVLQQVIDQKYVLKRDVYNPNNPDGWSTAETTTISVSSSNGGTSTGTTGVQNNMVTLTTQQYQLLVDNNLVDESTYYFTYEGEETTNWTFGGTFPITFNEDNGVGTFPITLT